MLLNFTKNQTLVLNIFFQHPEESFYLRQLARLLNKEPGVFQKDINRLVDDGLLISKKQANSRFFSLNIQHPLYNELKSLFSKTVGIEATLQKVFQNISGIKKAFIYGSFARGEEGADSDIDIIIVGSVDENSLLDQVSELEDKFQRPIHFTLISESEFNSKIKEGNSFFLNILKKEKIDLI